ncbi:fumarylacetoacetate hydrolase family protein [Phytohabitans kaempferiae]|uniref:Fumarylacetoacetate hydrolase family protein n=1 Tax=Phytohabitans kaempferiae TaxID=1620943 RepID=A0ABV6MHH3_9ACTN
MELAVRRPSKIVAVHLNYRSRAAQRGKVPDFPSYFLKPPSALAPPGVLARPAGTSLLGFEGEIALVIGTRAAGVKPADGWSHVAAVTAANDFGVYDMRAADGGSNVRSKGADGFLPIGPELIDARQVDPAGLRLRTWLNGSLAQEATTADLLFDFGYLVADLSQTLTLEPDDIILTGTPAGASVAVPGDLVEVEVDAGSLTSGRLTTRIAEGARGYRIGAQPATDPEVARLAWGTDG